MVSLEELFDREGISHEHRQSIRGYLNMLRKRDEATYRHALRVGVLASEIARHAGIPHVTAKMLLWAGLLHDVGKSLMSRELLSKKVKFTETDIQDMQPHVLYGWKLLQRIYDYTAHIIVRHHQFGARPYPAELPELPRHLREKKHTIEAAARILSLADFYDALLSREDDPLRKMLSARERRKVLIEHNPDMHDLIVKLESAGVLDFERPIAVEE